MCITRKLCTYWEGFPPCSCDINQFEVFFLIFLFLTGNCNSCFYRYLGTFVAAGFMLQTQNSIVAFATAHCAKAILFNVD